MPIIQNRTDIFAYSAMLFLVLVFFCSLSVNPWPTDRWFETHQQLFGTYLFEDNYTPISAPAIQYFITHIIADVFHLDLQAEFYLACALQNVLLFLTGCFVYRISKMLGDRKTSAVISIAFTLSLLGLGLPQAFWSENITLFLSAWFLFIVVMMHVNLQRSSIDPSWQYIVLCAFIVAALVVTRTTPIFLILAIGFLFFRRVSTKRLSFITGTLCVVTAVVVTSLMVSNIDRFGRFEYTSSSGRHLWQGVTSFSDKALVNSETYEQLRSIDPEIQGKSWWQITIVEQAEPVPGLQRDVILRKLAVEAIVAEPVLYIAAGIRKFVRTVGFWPWQLGFTATGSTNPLFRSEPLPSIGAMFFDFPQTLSTRARRIANLIHRIDSWMYPVLVFFVITTWFGMLMWHIKLFPIGFPQPAAGPKRLRRNVWLFLIPSTFTAYVINIGFGQPKSLIFLATSFAILAVLFILNRATAMNEIHISQSNSSSSVGVLYSFLIAIYFGSMWVGWQIESANSRTLIPYLPFLAAMIAIAVRFWRTVFHSKMPSDMMNPD